MGKGALTQSAKLITPSPSKSRHVEAMRREGGVNDAHNEV